MFVGKYWFGPTNGPQYGYGDGSYWEGNFKDGGLHGTGKKYNAQGKFVKNEKWENNKLIG